MTKPIVLKPNNCFLCDGELVDIRFDFYDRPLCSQCTYCKELQLRGEEFGRTITVQPGQRGNLGEWWFVEWDHYAEYVRFHLGRFIIQGFDKAQYLQTGVQS